VRAAARPSPRLEVLSAAPKGSRLEDMIDGLSQVGADAWMLLETDRAEVDPRPGKLERLRRVAAEASKQSGRPWLLEIGQSVQLAAALGRAGPGRSVVVADVSGEPYSRRGEPEISLLIGPEGGWSPAELAAVRRSSARVCRFGPHTMRIETAAVAAAAILLDAESKG
jgi:16S rRNA (uracil1498-N3)-methyltransferase